MTRGTTFASASLSRHLVRGGIGFGGLIGAFALVPVVGLYSLLLLPLGVLALRGCPMCWTIGLLETISNGRLRRACDDDRCSVAVVARE